MRNGSINRGRFSVPRAVCRIALPGFSLLVLPGCAHKIAGDTPYYKKGPYQIEPPDGDLKDGTWVWIVGAEGSYKHVLAANGVNAYVWSNALVPVIDWDHLFQPEEKQPPMPGLKPPSKQKPATTIFQPPPPKAGDETVQKRDASTAREAPPPPPAAPNNANP